MRAWIRGSPRIYEAACAAGKAVKFSGAVISLIVDVCFCCRSLWRVRPYAAFVIGKVALRVSAKVAMSFVEAS